MEGLSNLFKKRKRPTEVISLLKEELIALSGCEDDKSLLRIQQDIARRVSQLKVFIFGEADATREELAASAAQREEDTVAVAQCIIASEIVPHMLQHMKNLDLETRKGFTAVFNHLLRHNVADFATDYMTTHSFLLHQMIDDYAYPDVALCCGSMLRECIRGYIPLHEALLYGPDGGVSPSLRHLFEEHVHNPNFEVSADAFDTLSTILTTNKSTVLRFLDPEGDAASLARNIELFTLYNRSLQSDNYVLKRQALKLLSEFLLDRDNFTIMMRYISDKNNLKIVMLMLRNRQPNIQFEAFHVFKVFVANPEKPPEIVEILAANKGKLIAFLENFEHDKGDEQFALEKVMLIETLMSLPDMAIEPTHHTQTSSSFSSTTATSADPSTSVPIPAPAPVPSEVSPESAVSSQSLQIPAPNNGSLAFDYGAKSS